jgi:hypothetical protein
MCIHSLTRCQGEKSSLFIEKRGEGWERPLQGGKEDRKWEGSLSHWERQGGTNQGQDSGQCHGQESGTDVWPCYLPLKKGNDILCSPPAETGYFGSCLRAVLGGRFHTKLKPWCNFLQYSCLSVSTCVWGLQDPHGYQDLQVLKSLM